MVVASSEEAEVVGGGDGSRVLWERVGDGSGVLGDGGLLDVITTLGTNQETLMAENGVEVGGGALQEVEEGTAVDVWLLEVEVQFGTLGLRVRNVLGKDFGLQALGNVVVKLKLGIKSISGVPGLGKGEA